MSQQLGKSPSFTLSLGATSPRPVPPPPTDGAAPVSLDPYQQFENVALTVQMPNGATPVVLTVSAGETVQNVRRLLSEQHGLPLARLSLLESAGGKAMMDPLSLNDFASLRGQKAATLIANVAAE